MSRPMTYAEYQALAHEVFELVIPEGRFPMRLDRVTSLKMRGPYESFSLIFTIPVEENQFVQGDFPLEHPRLGKLQLFMAPLAYPLGDPHFQYYQASISRHPVTESSSPEALPSTEVST